MSVRINLKPGSILQFDHASLYKGRTWAVDTPNPLNITCIETSKLDGHLAEVVEYFGTYDAVYVPSMQIYIFGICATTVFKVIYEQE